ncbi:MAG: glycosyltransferase family 39 protein [Bacteroidota bacterium]
MNNRKIAIAIVILIGASVARIWQVPQLFYFGIDEEYQATIAWSIVKNFHLIWIGINSSIGFYLGPAFTYLNALLFYISKGDPAILGYFSSVVGISTTVSIIYISKKLYNTKAALTAGILYGFSAFIVFFDRRFWNPMPIPLISLWLYFSLVKALKNTRWLIVSISLMGLVYHLHLSLLIYWPFIIYIIIKRLNKIEIKTWILAIGLFLFLIFPLIVFDVNNNFIDTLMPLKFLMGTSVPGRSYSFAVIPHLEDLIIAYGQLWNIQKIPNVFHFPGFWAEVFQNIPILVASFLSFFLFLRTMFSKKNTPMRLLLIIISLFSVGYIFFPGWIFKFYLVGCYPLIILIISRYGSNYLKPKILGGILVVFISVNLFSLFTTSTSRGLTAKKNIVQSTINELGNDTYELTCMDCGWGYLGGWRYLFKTYGKTPNRSKIDKLFSRFYPEEISPIDPKKSIIIVDANSDIPDSLKKLQPTAQFGAYKTYILDYKSPYLKD